MKLAEKFPVLSFACDADEFLRKWSENTDVVAQLRERRIFRVEVVPLFISGAGILFGDDSNFLVYLNDFYPPEEQAYSLGHEIGHTFHFDLSKNPPQSSYPREAQDPVAESFCKEFSLLWVAQNSEKEIARRILNSAKLLVQCNL
mgnify:CR=1 FL=1